MENPVLLVSPTLSNLLIHEALAAIKAYIGYTLYFRKHMRYMRYNNERLKEVRVSVKKHMDRNRRDRLEIPSNVISWLEKAENIIKRVENMPPDVGCCLINIKTRHKIGRRAFKITREIENIMIHESYIIWTNVRIPWGKYICSMNASTNSALSSDHYAHEFQSREHIFNEALKALEWGHEYHMVALCGMDRVGKTTMMHRLKKVVLGKTFNFLVEVYIGLNPDMVAIQDDVARYLDIELNANAQPARIDMLRKRFEALSEGGTTKFLIILDDVWESIDLNDIGLGTLPNEEVKFKALLTSQEKNICNMMRVEPSLTLDFEVLKPTESHSLFRRVTGKSDDVDIELDKIGEGIVENCYNLPGVIQEIEDDLVNKSKDTSKDTFFCLEQQDIFNTIAPTGFKNNLSKLEETDTLLAEAEAKETVQVQAQTQTQAKEKVQAQAEVIQAKAIVKAQAQLQGKKGVQEEEEEEVQTKLQAKAEEQAKEVEPQAQLTEKEKVEPQAQLQAKSEVEAQAEAQLQANTEVEAQAQAKAELQEEGESQAQAQAQSLFSQLVDMCDDADPELQKIGEDIVRKCCSLSISIKTMAITLRNKSKDAWKDALSHLENLDIIDSLLDGDTKSIFLLCGLFPKGFEIPTEELVRYGWGLKVFDGVYSIREARIKLTTCIQRLIRTNLLMEGGDEGCIKMDNLVHAFSLDMFSKVEHASIVNHGSMSGWPETHMSRVCQRISLSCEGISEFPRELKFPNLKILKLMHGDKPLRLATNFYEDMKMLQVISYNEMKYPLLPSSPLQCFNLVVLHLHGCSLMYDCSSIGNLLNLEVLSFANSAIEWLPSTIGNLVKLRLLDLTGCAGLRIDTGVFKNLVRLEELYTISGSQYGKTISFTDDNCYEIAERSRKLTALEFEFFQNNAQLKNMSFENLERFKISVGHSLDGDFSKSRHAYENTLQIVTGKHQLLSSTLNELFEKTQVLYLCVGDMDCLPGTYSFNNVRVLIVSRCEELQYLFTVEVAEALPKLEHLQVSLCDNMEELIHIDESSGEETITFPKLKFLSLVWLRNLSGLCHNVHKLELPQLGKLELDGIPNFKSIYPKNELAPYCLLKEEVVIPNLEKLIIFNMENLEEIWPGECRRIVEAKLRDIKVGGCDNLVNLFPCNPMPLLHHLEQLSVENCGSIKALFNIDLDCEVETEKGGSSNLRNIQMKELGKLREVWSIEGETNNSRLPICGFQAVESIQIERCKSFKNVFTPTATTKLDLGALIDMNISDCGESSRDNESVDCSQEEENNLISNKDTLENRNSISNAVFPSYLTHSFHNLRSLSLSNWEGVPEVVFEIESPKDGELVTTQDYQQCQLPNLEILEITCMERMSNVWKCNWNKYFILQTQQSDPPFHNLTTICVKDCASIKYLFTPHMAKLLSNLMRVQIQDCDGIEEVVSRRYDEDTDEDKYEDADEEMTMSTSTQTSISLFPHLDSLTLSYLPNLKCVGGDANGGNTEFSLKSSTISANFLDQLKSKQVSGVSWTLCQYFREISISYCDALSSVIPCYALGQMQKLQVLRITRCDSMKEVFESQWIKNNNSGCGSSTSNIDEGNGSTPASPGLNHVIVLKLPMLRVLELKDCDLLEHVFTISTLQSLVSLEQLIIWDCKAMKVIVKETHDGEPTTSSEEDVVFPCLKSIALVNLPNLIGFFLGRNKLWWPSLDDVTIKGCPQMIAFTLRQSLAPGVKYIRRSLGKHSLDEGDLNFHLTTTTYHQTQDLDFEDTRSCSATAEGVPWSFQNLIELDVKSNISLKKIIPSNKLLQLQKLEKIHVSYCHEVEEVFEAFKVTRSGLDESQTVVVKLPNLREVKLAWLDSLRNMLNSNQWTVFEFRNLTSVSILGCYKLEHVFTRSMVGCLLQLQELQITNCDHMGEVIGKDANVVVAEEGSDGKINRIELPCLRSLVLDQLPRLKGFCLGKEDFSFPLLDTLRIMDCPALTNFTKGNSSTPELIEIETSFGSFYAAGEDMNSFIDIKKEEFKRNRRIK